VHAGGTPRSTDIESLAPRLHLGRLSQLSGLREGCHMTQIDTKSTRRISDAAALLIFSIGGLLTLAWIAFVIWLALKIYSLR
jgi:hypothetical protein